jgi:hypothetical protein
MSGNEPAMKDDEVAGRLGEIIDEMVRRAGMPTRMIPGSLFLSKPEALLVLTDMQTLEALCERAGGLKHGK